MIEAYSNEIQYHIQEMYQGYENEDSDTSIIFHLDGKYYLAIYNTNVKYIFDKSINLYENLIFGIQVRNKLSLFNNFAFYIEEAEEDYISEFYMKRKHDDPTTGLSRSPSVSLPKFEPTGEIFELNDLPEIFKNMDILTDYLMDKTYSKDELYSLMISPSFEFALSKASPIPAENEPPKASRFVDFSAK